jgi:hypothetical protein
MVSIPESPGLLAGFLRLGFFGPVWLKLLLEKLRSSVLKFY